MIQHLVMLVLALILAGPAHAQRKPAKPSSTVSLVYDVTLQRNLYSDNAERVISIASMTKLIAVMTVLEADQDLSELLAVVRSRDSSPRIRAGMKISRLDLISLAMISSDNLATRTLMEYYPGGYASGITAMNNLVKKLGASTTTLVEPTGIMAANTSTADDLAKIARVAALNPLFAILANQRQTEISVEKTSRARLVVEWIVGRATNPFVGHDNNFRIIVAKTGFTTAAGFCLVMVVEINSHRYVLITAGHPNKQSRKKRADELIQEINRSYRIQISNSDDEQSIEP